MPQHTYREDVIQLLVMRIKDHRSDGILRFSFTEFEAQFDQADFFIITSLRIAPLATTPTHSWFHAREFGGEGMIYFGNVETIFHEECRNINDESDLSFKLSLLVFLYGVILNDVGRYNNPINVRFMYVIDNMDNFNNHPWWLEGYNVMVKSMYKMFDANGSTKVSQRPIRIGAEGFATAQQL